MLKVVILGGFAESLVNFRGPMLQEMVNKGHQVVACAPGASNEIQNLLGSMGVKYQNVTLDRNRLNPIKDIISIYRLVKLFRKIKPHIFFGYTIKPVIYGSLAAKLAGVPHRYSMITGLGSTFNGNTLKSRIIERLIRKLYCLSLKYSQNIFFQNKDDLKLFSDEKILLDKKRTVLINGSGVDTDYYQPANFPKNLSFLMIARFLKNKGLREYAEASRIIKSKYPNIVFRLVGWFDNNPSTISANELNSWINEGIIEYLGKLNDVRPAIANSSIYVLPSYREGLPRTVLEAMAMGRPVITTDTPGCRETVHEGQNGFLIPVKSVKALVNVMETFINKPEIIKKLGQESRKIAVAKFEVKKVNEILLETMGL